MHLHHHILNGNCIELLPTLPPESIDLVVTDPPYLCRYRDRDGRTLANDDAPDQVLGAFAPIYRALKPNTYCVSFYGWHRIDAFFRAWTEAGFRPVGHLVWHKGYASRRGILNARHEQAYLLAKGQPDKPLRPIDDVLPWEYSGNRHHPTEKTVSVIRPLVEAFSPPGGIVLDPFAGSGSTLVAAALTGRRAVGIELEAKYTDLIQRRLAGVERYCHARAA
jgi:site-specific DNA-methyltransferase (adenine-specific)